MAARLATMRESGMVSTEQKQVALENLRVTTSKSDLPAFYFLWTSGFYVRTTKICKVLLRWTSEVKKQFFYSGNYSIFHLDDQTQPTFEMTPRFKPLCVIHRTN